jgi:L-ascorbate metabolism protein UlaG (beta-lactamase superfamily)
LFSHTHSSHANMKVQYLGHSCMSVEVQGKYLLFDPFVSPNKLAENIDIDEIKADYILISHGHQDHIADAIRIAQRSGALLICSWEIYVWLSAQGLDNIRPMNTGGSFALEGVGAVKCVTAHHSSGLPDGSYGGNPMGFLITSDEGNFYYSGDTALTLDMQLIPMWAKLNFAFLCLGDNFTMGVADAVLAAKFIACDTIIGMHYDTFGYIVINHEAAKAAFSGAGKALHLLEIGAVIDMG